jgi:hypothetical protein
MAGEPTEDTNASYESLLDVFVYAPIGFLLDARELLPQLASRGRSHIALLKVGAKFAVAKGRIDADNKLRAKAAAAPVSARPTAQPATTAGSTTPPPQRRSVRAQSQSTPADRRLPSPAKVPTSDQLPIRSYDTLSASQIVPRLDALGARDLSLVERYETQHRRRRTILGRIDQLRTGRR